MVAFAFLPQNFEKVVGPRNDILSICKCSLQYLVIASGGSRIFPRGGREPSRGA